MRVRFGELSVDESRAREEACARARRAWSFWAEGDPARACELMNAIDSRIELTAPRRDGSPATAELSALEAAAWPLAELLLAQAPSDFGHALSLGRPAVSLERALAEVRASHRVELEHAQLRAGFGRAHLLELTLGVPGGMGSENEQNAAENLVRAVLGDRLFETWIGAVHVTAAPRGGPLRVLDSRAPRSSLQLRELFDTVAAAARGVLLGLPALSRAADATISVNGSSSEEARESSSQREDWTMFEIEPLDASSRRRKDDLVLASTCTPELLRCYLDDAPCSSRRFSRAGEHFVFVSYADEESRMSRRVAKRSLIETALAAGLGDAGAITGVGLGVKTTYVDFAVCDLETGLARLISKLRDVDAPADTFIRFFDSELADEWLSIWPDSRITEG